MSEPTRFKMPAFLSTPEYRAYQTEIEQKWRADKEAEQRVVNLEARARRLAQSTGLTLTDHTRQLLVRGALHETPALRETQDWNARHDRPCLVLSGATGTGKSVAAAWFVAERGALWFRAESLVRLFSASFGDQYEDQDRVRGAAALVIDDLGCELDSERALLMLLDLLEHRKSGATLTLITTNLTYNQFTARYRNERLRSRLEESVMFVGCGSLDLRRRSA